MCHRGLAMVRALTVMLTDGHEEGSGMPASIKN
jgi:hypothetical protein